MKGGGWKDESEVREMSWEMALMLVSDMLIPVIMLSIGLLFYRRPPVTINGAFGYRTRMSMRNEETWEFAHRYFGRLWFLAGIPLLALTCAVWAFMLVSGMDDGRAENLGLIVLFLQMIPLMTPIVPTERALRREFDKEGNRRR